MARRDLRSGELRLLFAAVVLAVCSVCAVSWLSDRIRAALTRDAASLLAADALVVSDRPIDAALGDEARAAGLRTALVQSFPSMAMGSDPLAAGTLVSVKAVGDGYPLRGELRIRDDAGADRAGDRPGPGAIWVDERLAGDATLQLGRARFEVRARILSEPDRASAMLGFAPRVLLRLEDLDATGLVQPGSRVEYRLLLAGEAERLNHFLARVRPTLQRGQRIETATEGRQDLRSTVEGVERFLGLVAVLTALLASLGVAVSARHFVDRRVDSVALLRCLGMTSRQVLAGYLVELLAVGVLASLAGVAAGYALHLVLAGLVAPLAPVDALPPARWLPVAHGLATGALVLLAFALAPLWRLGSVPPLRVFRRDLQAAPMPAWQTLVPGVLAVALLLLWAGGGLRLSVVSGGAIAACAALLAVMAWGSLGLLRRLRSGAARSAGLDALGVQWRFALDALRRRPAAAVLQVTALGLGLTALLTLALVRSDLLRQWSDQAPADAPDHFAINIQPDQVTELRALLDGAGIAAPVYPMIRGRLVAIDGRAIGPSDYEDGRARSLVEREFNLSYADEAPAGNRIVQGQWCVPGSGGLSIEQGIAGRLGIQLGQVLRFDIAGSTVEARVTSVRALQWSSMRVNFFAMLDPDLLRDAPQTYITAFRVPQSAPDLAAGLVRRMPNVTLIDVGQVLAQVQSLLGHLARGAQWMFSLTVVAGVLVILACLLATQGPRLREAALLRAMGATRRQLLRIQVLELCLLGALAGLLAALGATLLCASLAHWVFDFTFVPRPALLLLAPLAGCLCALAAGAPGARRIVATPPWRLLREA